jgi:hypothetical protein
MPCHGMPHLNDDVDDDGHEWFLLWNLINYDEKRRQEREGREEGIERGRKSKKKKERKKGRVRVRRYVVQVRYASRIKPLRCEGAQYELSEWNCSFVDCSHYLKPAFQFHHHLHDIAITQIKSIPTLSLITQQTHTFHHHMLQAKPHNSPASPTILLAFSSSRILFVSVVVVVHF